MTMWGGRFDEPGADALVRAINDSLPFDRALAAQDIQGSRAWARALAAARVLTEDEAARLIDALNKVETLAAKSKQAIVESGAEDIHTWVESELVRLVGDLGKKLHTGRSRNDQVATDLRLWTRAEIAARTAEIRLTQSALIDLAERESRVILPGYTHLQRAQPVPFAHWCLAYVEMLERDAGRFADAAKRANECTLGSGALAGAAYPIDREALAEDLGFDAPTRNSLDAVSDRDFAVESLAACALCQVHLSRLAEDLIIYATGEFGFVAISDAASTGSSLMPQKKNPDALELMRGKTGRVTGALVALLTALKGLPLAYNKDMQEDKEPLFDAMRALSLSLRVAPMVLSGLRVDAQRCEAAAKAGYSNATDVADYLVARGVPFRDAHAVAGRLVRRALAQGVALDDLPMSDYQDEHKAFAPDVLKWIDLRAGMERRNVIGGAAPSRVAAALKEAKERVRGALEGARPCPSN